MAKENEDKLMDKSINKAKNEVYSGIINSLRSTSFGLSFNKKNE